MSHNPRRQFGNTQVALAVDATIKSNLFQILGIYRQGESATPAEQMAAADDIMSRLVAAIEDTFSPSIASYALSRQIHRRPNMADGGRVCLDLPRETTLEAVKRRQKDEG